MLHAILSYARRLRRQRAFVGNGAQRDIMAAGINLGVRGRLIAGFAAVCVVLAVTVGATIVAVSQMSGRVGKVFSLRTPVAIASTQMVANLYGTLSTLRGYLLTGDAEGKAARAAMWGEVDRTTEELDRLAAGFGDAENVRLWREVKTQLGAFREAQKRVEEVAFTPDAYPATRILTEQAAPLSATIFGELTKMINVEEKLEATAARKRLLKTLADARGNFAAAVAQLRLYVLSGDKAERTRYETPMKTFKAALAALGEQKELFDPAQQTSFQTITTADRAYEPLTEKVFALRDSPQWNMPVFLLATEAAPRAAALLDLLDGRKGADGRRSGGLKTIQQAKLVVDSEAAAREIDQLLWAQWALLGIGLALGALCSVLVARSITRPIADLVGDARRLAAGDTTVAFHTAARRDEIGIVAGAVAAFRDNVKAQQQAAASFAAEVAEREARNRHMEQTVEAFRATAATLLDTVGSNSGALKQTAEKLTGIAGGAAEQALSAASASEETATGVQTVAAAAAGAIEQQNSATQEIARNVQLAAAGTQTLAGSIAAVNGAIGATSSSADDVFGASARVTTASEDLATQVRDFFIRLREGPMDRRKGEDPEYRGPERRGSAGARRAA
jgi:methyl-accepting chemotaxis protein